jgi:hypothetical protein
MNPVHLYSSNGSFSSAKEKIHCADESMAQVAPSYKCEKQKRNKEMTGLYKRRPISVMLHCQFFFDNLKKIF